MAYYWTPQGDTGYIDPSGRRWENPGNDMSVTDPSVTWMDFTPEQIAASSGHFGILSGEFSAQDPRWTGGVGNAPTMKFNSLEERPDAVYARVRLPDGSYTSIFEHQGKARDHTYPAAVPAAPAAGAGGAGGAGGNAAQFGQALTPDIRNQLIASLNGGASQPYGNDPMTTGVVQKFMQRLSTEQINKQAQLTREMIRKIMLGGQTPQPTGPSVSPSLLRSAWKPMAS